MALGTWVTTTTRMLCQYTSANYTDRGYWQTFCSCSHPMPPNVIMKMAYFDDFLMIHGSLLQVCSFKHWTSIPHSIPKIGQYTLCLILCSSGKSMTTDFAIVNSSAPIQCEPKTYNCTFPGLSHLDWFS